MKTIIEAPNGGVLSLGRQGENLARRVKFKLPPNWDMSDPAASVQLVARRAEESTAYPVMLSCEDDVYYWDVTSADTGRDGCGLCELRYMLGDVLAKSMTWTTHVAESISDDLTEPPDAAQNYLSQVMAEGAKAASAADRAESTVLKMPYIENGIWMVWDFDQQAYVSTGVSAGGGSGEGTPGAVFTPHVDADGNISWTNNGGLDNPETVNIMGPQGEKGETGPQGPQGDPGNNGSDGGYYTPTVSQPDANTLRVAYTPSQEGMPEAQEVDVSLPQGSPGKTAYQYAQDGGYTGSETEFAAKLAAEHLPVPATAAVGQYFRAKTVDENGLVTEVEAVDATGGGGGKLLIDYVHDDDKLAYVIQITGYNAGTGVWTTDGAIDLTTVTFEPFSQISLKDPLAKIGPENQSSLLGQTIGRVTVTGTNTFTFSSNPNTTEFTPDDYVLIPNVKVTFASIPSTVKRMRMVLEGQFLAGTRYCTFGWNEWFDPNGQTTVAAEKKYRAGKAIYSVIVSDFHIENGYIRGTTKQIYFDTGAIGSAEGIYFPTAGESFPDMVFSRYAHVGYEAMPYKGRVRLYDMEGIPWVF